MIEKEFDGEIQKSMLSCIEQSGVIDDDRQLIADGIIYVLDRRIELGHGVDQYYELNKSLNYGDPVTSALVIEYVNMKVLKPMGIQLCGFFVEFGHELEDQRFPTKIQFESDEAAVDFILRYS